MEKYESKQQQIFRPADQIYGVLSDFRNFTPLLYDKVEEWQADETSCSFKVKGFTVCLRIEDKVPGDYIKIVGEDGGPVEFTFWVQMKQVEMMETRMRLVLHAKLNMLMKMMIGGKLQEGIDRMAEMMADAFNGKMPEGYDEYASQMNLFGSDKPVS